MRKREGEEGRSNACHAGEKMRERIWHRWEGEGGMRMEECGRLCLHGSVHSMGQ